MKSNKISDKYFVSPQIQETDIRAIADAGFSKVICNRPNNEVSSAFHSDVMSTAAQAAMIDFDFLPFTALTLKPETVKKQGKLIEESKGPVIAYCESGTRCALIWAFLQAGKMRIDEILQATNNAGYNLEGLRGILGDQHKKF